MEVISLEEGKVTIKDKVVIKKSSISEVNSLVEAAKKIKNHTISINGVNYKINVPEVYDFYNETITMERCFGNNLEIMLRNGEEHKKGVIYTNQILNEFLNKKLLWKDYAPRNIMIDDDTISIMDFERGIDPENTNLFDYFVESVYEEYGAFLLPEERICQMDEVLKTDREEMLSIKDISSKRVRTILTKLGYQGMVPLSEYVKVVKMIIINEEPYIENNDIVYPLIELENYLTTQGYDKYADKIIGGYNEKFKGL